MRRGSFGRKLPRGRLDHKVSPALLGVAMFLVILVPSLFYLFPHALDSIYQQSYSSDLLSRLELKSSTPSFSENPSLDNETDGNLAGGFVAAETKNSNASEPVQNVASKGASLLATVYLLPEISQVYLENTGSTELHHVQIVGGGRSLGILSELICGEKKVLAVSGSPEELQVSALDPTEGKVLARVQYISRATSDAPNKPHS